MIRWEIASSVLICVILFIRRVFKRRISLRLQYGLWGLVLVRLLIPVNFFYSEWSVLNGVEDLSIVQSIDDLEGIGEIEYTNRGTVEGYKDSMLMPDIPIIVAKDVSEQKFSQYKYILQIRPVLDGVRKSGMLIGAFILLKSNLEFAERLKKTRRKLEDTDGKILVYSSEEVATPCLFGIVHPAIYVTEEVASEREVMKYVLAHEMTHYRQGDHIWSFLRGVCLILHWYNPLVWIAVRLSKQDGELSCDEGTIQHMGEHERTTYGRVLIGLTCEEKWVDTSLVAATTMMGSGKEIKERIELVAKKPFMVWYVFAAVILVVCIAVIGTFSGVKKKSEFSEWLNHVSVEEFDVIYVSTGYGTEEIGHELTEEEKVRFVDLLHEIEPDELNFASTKNEVLYSIFMRGNGREVLFQFENENSVYVTFDSVTAQEFEIDGKGWCIEKEELADFAASLFEDDGMPVVLKSENKVPKAAVEYAQEAIRKSAEGFNRTWKNHNFQLSVTEAELMMDSISTGAASENISIQMYEVGFRMRLEGDAKQYFGEGMKYEEVDGVYWLTGYSNTDVVYIFLSCEEKDGEEIWTRLGMINPEDLEFYYGTEEMQEKYGNIYTAAAMEIYYAAK